VQRRECGAERLPRQSINLLVSSVRNLHRQAAVQMVAQDLQQQQVAGGEEDTQVKPVCA
jgi:hypothetical protein